jgi:hypothetical protein
VSTLEKSPIQLCNQLNWAVTETMPRGMKFPKQLYHQAHDLSMRTGQVLATVKVYRALYPTYEKDNQI